MFRAIWLTLYTRQRSFSWHQHTYIIGYLFLDATVATQISTFFESVDVAETRVPINNAIKFEGD